MCIQRTRVIYSVVITRPCNLPISEFNSPCNEFTSVWSMFAYNSNVNFEIEYNSNDKIIVILRIVNC